MQSNYVYAAVALGGALLAILVYHLAIVRPALDRCRRLLEVHDGLIAGDGGRAADRLAALEGGSSATNLSLERVAARVEALEALAASDLSRCGFVRYDAFADSGSGLSYALALLNRQGDGVVLTSIYSRTDTRTYGKPVSAFTPTIQASQEELDAIERARTRPS